MTQKMKSPKADRGLALLVSLACVLWVASPLALAQTATTGALTGTVSDPTGAVVPGVEITVANQATGEVRVVTSGSDGTYVVPVLLPGSYRIEAKASGFKLASRSDIRIAVTETARLDIPLELGDVTETVMVEADTSAVQADSSALGRVATGEIVVNVPLVTRNFTQIIVLSPGITQGVNNAGELGRGSGLTLPGRLSVHGSRVYDHNLKIDGVDANDFEMSTGGNTAGNPIPNPDALLEFKVQTGLYDAAYGRNAGANVNVITKSGGNDFHGSLFYFLRNEALNANDFFFNRAGQEKPELRQNQGGFSLGGPIKKEKLLFFGSYQGTRQTNALTAGTTRAKCSSTIFSPPLTNDRSAAALGAMFATRSGQNGGTAILADGSNISPIALALLQRQGPGGGLLLPNPQVVDPSQPFDQQGFSVFSNACTFDEDQFLTSIDYLHSDKSKLVGKFFYADSDQLASFARSSNNVSGFPLTVVNEFRLFSLAHHYTFTPSLINELRLGFNRGRLAFERESPFNWSDVGVLAGQDFDGNPALSITGSYNFGTCCPLNLPQNTFVINDNMSHVRGRHSLRFGGGITHYQDNIVGWVSPGQVSFLSFPDFLLGLDGDSNGSGFSNLFSSSYFFGPGADKEGRVWDGSLYIQDDFNITSRLTLNLGLRYERIGHYAEGRGQNANFNPLLANPNPPAGGSLAGWVVAANYPSDAPVIPAEVVQDDNGLTIAGDGQNNFAPRIGFAWQVLPQSSRVVLRGGYGIYYSRTPGQAIYNALGIGVWAVYGGIRGAPNTQSWANPFLQPTPAITDFPLFNLSARYSPTTTRYTNFLDQNFRPPITQQISLNLQTEIATDFMLEVGYVGTRGTQLLRPRSINQALLASPSNPIRTETTNTVSNVGLRVPFRGFAAEGLRIAESAGGSWYNGLEVSFSKRPSKGLQFLASYTWSKNLDSDGQNIFSSHNARSARGDQNDWRLRYGRSEFDRAHRFIISYLYELPSPAGGSGVAGKLLGGWGVSGVTTLQSGTALTLTATNAANLFGITGGRAMLAAGCSHGDLLTSGSLTSKLTNYFNTACITTSFPVIGDDGLATAFGNSGVGIVDGPPQSNFDFAIIKNTSVGWLGEATNFQFRAEFFNLFNTPQFSNPSTNASSGAFGNISSTSVAPRIMQFALKFIF